MAAEKEGGGPALVVWPCWRRRGATLHRLEAPRRACRSQLHSSTESARSERSPRLFCTPGASWSAPAVTQRVCALPERHCPVSPHSGFPAGRNPRSAVLPLQSRAASRDENPAVRNSPPKVSKIPRKSPKKTQKGTTDWGDWAKQAPAWPCAPQGEAHEKLRSQDGKERPPWHSVSEVDLSLGLDSASAASEPTGLGRRSAWLLAQPWAERAGRAGPAGKARSGADVSRAATPKGHLLALPTGRRRRGASLRRAGRRRSAGR